MNISTLWPRPLRQMLCAMVLAAFGWGASPCAAQPACAPGDTQVDFSHTGGLQPWVVPSGVTSVTITAVGADGGSTGGAGGGSGATITGTVAVTPGETLAVVVGEAGESQSESGGGGGGSFVARGAAFSAFGTDLLLAAGGGGGGGGFFVPGRGATVGGSAGLGGDGPYAAGGAGVLGDGDDGALTFGGGMAIQSGASGGTGGGVDGGFGGGGSGADERGGGGGGGASGGDGGTFFAGGFGGTSINADVNTPGVDGGGTQSNGSVTICYSLITGACCRPSGTCDILTELACVSVGNTYLGDDEPCDPGVCGAPMVIPTVSEWGQMIAGLLLLIAVTFVTRRLVVAGGAVSY